MKVELSEPQIRNTLWFLRQVELKGANPAVLIEMAGQVTLYQGFLESQEPEALPAVDADKPNRAARRKAKKS